jgi:23S rRNA (guanosine2251-2'-O)-methyltransferase
MRFPRTATIGLSVLRSTEELERIPYLATQAAAPYQGLRPIPVSVLLHNVRSLYNVGAFFRTIDAAGCDKLYLSGITGRPPHRSLAKTALGAEETVAWEHHPKPSVLIRKLREQGNRSASALREKGQ